MSTSPYLTQPKQHHQLASVVPVNLLAMRMNTIRNSPDQSLDSKSDHGGEQEERSDQDVEQRQSCEGLRGSGTLFIEEVMHHKRLQDKNL